MGLKHAFKSLKTDPADATIIGATKWNADHYYVDDAGAPVGNVGALLLAGAAGALTHLNSVAAGQVLTSAGVGALPVWAAGASVPAALVADSLTLSIANPDVVLSRGGANSLLLGGASFSLLQFGGTTAAFPALKRSSGELHVRNAADGNFGPLRALWISAEASQIYIGAGVLIGSGSGSPEGVNPQPVGSIYLRNDGAAGATFYVKETGGATVTGWVAK